MKLSQIKNLLRKMDTFTLQLPDGQYVPRHFHLTEIGKVTKHFIDCGGNLRMEEIVNFQLFHTKDFDHNLPPGIMLRIIENVEKVLNLADLEIEVEYQGRSLEKYNLDFDGTHFLLTAKHTDCLANDRCGIPYSKSKLAQADPSTVACCSPNSGCC